MQNYETTCFNAAFVDTANIENEEKSPSLDLKSSNNYINENHLPNNKSEKSSSIRVQLAKKKNQYNYLSPQAQSKIESPEQLFDLVQSPKPKVQEYSQLKQTIRTTNWSIDHPIRRNLWKSIVQLNQNQSHQGSQHKQLNVNNDKENNKNICLSSFDFDISEYNRQLNLIFGKDREIENDLPEFTRILPNSSSNVQNASSPTLNNRHLNYYYLNSKGKEAIKRILCVFEYNFPHVTFSPGLVSISSLLLHYMQEHEVFSALCLLSSTKDHFIETKSNWETTCSVFAKLLKTYSRSSYENISKYATEPLDVIFNDWYFWIFDSLSFKYLVKIMDCFLFEGQKVFYRIGLAIAHQFSKSIKIEKIVVNKESITVFSKKPFAFESVEHLLKDSFSIRNLKRSTIKNLYLKEEEKRKINIEQTNNQSKPNLNENTKILNSTNQNDNQLTSLNSRNNQVANGPFDHANSPKIFLKESTTSILSHSLLCIIWNWIPQRLSLSTPKMLFTTEENGTSLNTLFNVLDDLEYCLIVIKTFQNEIFGAFCSCSWVERYNSKSYFGNGETFLFTLCPNKRVYRWTGTRGKTLSNQELFIRVSPNKISIGGGGHDGLSIDKSLINGSTNRCDTFENEQLASEKDFEIAIVEVIGFED